MQRLGEMLDWLENNPALTAGLAVAWVLVLIVSLRAGHRFLITIPPDYFTRQHQPLERWRETHRAWRWTLLVAKNLTGAVLVLLGLVMLFTPGQGILTLLLGLSLADFPGKRALERRVVRQPRILHGINQLRAKAHQPPLVFEEHDPHAG